MIFFAGISAASNDPALLTASSNAGLSPFSIALQHAGWSHGPDLINAFILTATASAVNSAIYVASRTLYSLAICGRAPKFLAKTGWKGVPVNAAIASNAVGLLALLNISNGAGKVFSYLISISGAATFVAWACIGITHLRFRRAWYLQGHTPDELPFRAILFPWGPYFTSALNIFLLLIQGYGTLLTPFKPVDFVFSYIVIVLFLAILLFWKFYKRTKLVNLAEVDLHYGRRLPAVGQDETEPAFFTKAARWAGRRLRS